MFPLVSVSTKKSAAPVHLCLAIELDCVYDRKTAGAVSVNIDMFARCPPVVRVTTVLRRKRGCSEVERVWQESARNGKASVRRDKRENRVEEL